MKKRYRAILLAAGVALCAGCEEAEDKSEDVVINAEANENSEIEVTLNYGATNANENK